MPYKKLTQELEELANSHKKEQAHYTAAKLQEAANAIRELQKSSKDEEDDKQ